MVCCSGLGQFAAKRHQLPHSRNKVATALDFVFAGFVNYPNRETTAVFDKDLLKAHLELIEIAFAMIVRHHLTVHDPKQVLNVVPFERKQIKSVLSIVKLFLGQSGPNPL